MAKATPRRGGLKNRPARGQAAKRPATRKSAVKPAPKKHVLSPDARLTEANRLAQKGDIPRALKIVGEILQKTPDHRPTIKYLWLLLWSTGQFDLALAAGKETLLRATDSPRRQEELAAYFLNAAMERAKENPSFIPHVNRAIDFVSDFAGHPKMFGTLHTMIQHAQGNMSRHADTLKTGMDGLALYPNYSKDFYHNNSVALFHLGRLEESVASFGRKLIPFNGKAPRTKLVQQYKTLAANYDANRVHQSYGPTMAQLIVKTVGATVNKRILDAGCGTGALGTQIRAAHLVGIDLSPDMLAKARERNIYQELVEGDLVAKMAKRSDRFDIIASTAVLCHIADLGPFFRQAARLLVPGGHLFFSTDPALDSMEIGVNGPGEYAHSRAYIRRLATQTGFAEIAVRIMEHRGNPGFWFAFRRQ